MAHAIKFLAVQVWGPVFETPKLMKSQHGSTHLWSQNEPAESQHGSIHICNASMNPQKASTGVHICDPSKNPWKTSMGAHICNASTPVLWWEAEAGKSPRSSWVREWGSCNNDQETLFHNRWRAVQWNLKLSTDLHPNTVACVCLHIHTHHTTCTIRIYTYHTYTHMGHMR